MTTVRYRRSLLAAMSLACLLVGSAQAEAPQAKVQAPGFYRMMLGDVEITALSDGTFELNTSRMLTDTKPAQLHELLKRSFEPNEVPTSVNAYLINTGNELVLVDTGAAKLFGPTLGRLFANVTASGYRPEQVDAILITHMHPDHIGGLTTGGNRMFPNATVYVEEREADFWLNPASMNQSPDEKRYMFDDAVASIAPYASAGKLKRFRGLTDLFPGIRAIPVPGHTPGHTMYAIVSKGHELVLWGDLMEIASVQFAVPTVTIAFDSDPREAVAEREKAYASAAREGYLVAGAHLPFPGIGHVRTERTGYAWVPIDYDIVR